MQLKVDVSDSCDIPVTCRQALFVFYNCARLSKILEKYKNEVDKGRHGMLSSTDKNVLQWPFKLFVLLFQEPTQHYLICKLLISLY
jgi:hypothetical protein